MAQEREGIAEGAEGEVAAGIAALDDEADKMDREDGVVTDETTDGSESAEDDVDEVAGNEDDSADAIDDEDELDDLVDDDDLDDDENDKADEKEVEAITREDGAEWNVEAKRWVKDGKFVDGDAPAAATKVADGKDGKDGKGAAGASGEPEWQPFAIQVDRKPFEIPEAAVSRRKGADGKDYVFLAIPETDFNRFTNRVGVGVVAQRMSRELESQLRQVEQLKAEVEEDRKAPRARTDAEIEAELYIKKLREKGVLAEVLEPHEIELLDRDVKLAIRDEKDAFAKRDTERREARADASGIDEKQSQGLADTVIEVVETFPEFKDLSDEQLREVYKELLPYRRALYWREDGEWFKNTEQVHAALKRKVESLKNGGSSAPRTAPAVGAKTGANAGGKTGAANAADRDERFNAGQRTAARPGSTSVKAQRDATQRPGQGDRVPANREQRRDGKGKNGQRRGTSAQRHEAEHRKKVRNWMSSNNLDFPE